MFETLFPVLLGGFLAIIGGAVQSLLSIRNNARCARIEKREDAYLGYIEAILKIKVDYKLGRVIIDGYWDKFQNIQAKLRLYGSKNILDLEATFADNLYESWDCGYDVTNIEMQKDILLRAIRAELNVN